MIPPDPGRERHRRLQPLHRARQIVRVVGRQEAGEVQRLDVAGLARQDLLGPRERALPVTAAIVDGRPLQR